MTCVYVVIARGRTTDSQPVFRSLWRTKSRAVAEARRLARNYEQRHPGLILRVEDADIGAIVYAQLSSGAFDVYVTYAAESHEIQGSAIDALAEVARA